MSREDWTRGRTIQNVFLDEYSKAKLVGMDWSQSSTFAGEKTMSSKEVKKEYQLEVTQWNIRDAEYDYKLTVFAIYENGERRIEDTHYGDREWAQANGQHFGIKVPAEPQV